MVIVLTFFIVGRQNSSLYHSILSMTIEYLPVSIDYNVYIVEFVKHNNVISCINESQAKQGKTLFELTIELVNNTTIVINKDYIITELVESGLQSDIHIKIVNLDGTDEDALEEVPFTIKNHPVACGLVVAGTIFYIADLLIRFFFS